MEKKKKIYLVLIEKNRTIFNLNLKHKIIFMLKKKSRKENNRKLNFIKV